MKCNVGRQVAFAELGLRFIYLTSETTQETYSDLTVQLDGQARV
jgi:hypothetical protein